MRDMEKLCTMLEDKIQEYADRGLTTANVDLVYKMADILKDMKNIAYWDVKSTYYEDQLGSGYSGDYPDNYSSADGYSGARRRRDSRGRYSRDSGERGYSYDSGGRDYTDRDDEMYSRYRQSKQSYRNGGGAECKQRLMNTLEDYMEGFSKKMEEMLRDSDCSEERETIQRYLHKLKNLG